MVETAGVRHGVLETELGGLTLVGDGDALVGVYYPEHRPHPDPSGFGLETEVGDDPVLRQAAGQLQEYLAGGRITWQLPLRVVGSERAHQVWRLISEIPYGGTTTYKALADEVGQGIGPRAVGGYVARNPLSIIVPCHRVVGSNGSLTGYAGGLERKRRLLELEGARPVGRPTRPAPGTEPAQQIRPAQQTASALPSRGALVGL